MASKATFLANLAKALVALTLWSKSKIKKTFD